MDGYSITTRSTHMQVMVPDQYGWCGQRLVSRSQRYILVTRTYKGGQPQIQIRWTNTAHISTSNLHSSESRARQKLRMRCVVSVVWFGRKWVLCPLLERGVVAIARNAAIKWRMRI